MDTQAVLDLMKQVAAEVITPRFRSLADGEVIEKNPGDLVSNLLHRATADADGDVCGLAVVAIPGPRFLGVLPR